MKIIGKMHNDLIYNRRMNILASRISALLPTDAKVLDVGCGDGMIDKLIMTIRPDVSIVGIDVFVREHTHVPVSTFDGKNIPFDDASFDTVMFIDVLHHTDCQKDLLREAKRVSRDTIVLKDHTLEGPFAGLTLRFMDWVGNAHHGVVLPYNFWDKNQWEEAFESMKLNENYWDGNVGLYPWPLSMFFDRSLHFVAALKV